MEHVVMTPVGWAFMIAAWAVIGGLTFWCFYKLLTTPQQGGVGEGDGGADDGGADDAG